MKIGDLKKVISTLPNDYDLWINDEGEPDEVSVSFEYANVTLIVKQLKGNMTKEEK